MSAFGGRGAPRALSEEEDIPTAPRTLPLHHCIGLSHTHGTAPAPPPQAGLAAPNAAWAAVCPLPLPNCTALPCPLQAGLAASDAVEAERRARHTAESDAVSVVRECERRVAELESQLAQAQAHARMAAPGGGGGGRGGRGSLSGGAAAASEREPTLAAPGYHWVLLKEGEGPAQQQQQPAAPRARTSSEGQHGSAFHHPAAEGAVAAAAAAEMSDLLPQLGGRTPSGSMGGGGGPLLAAGAEALRMELRMKQTEVAALEARVKELTLTRDQ